MSVCQKMNGTRYDVRTILPAIPLLCRPAYTIVARPLVPSGFPPAHPLRHPPTPPVQYSWPLGQPFINNIVFNIGHCQLRRRRNQMGGPPHHGVSGVIRADWPSRDPSHWPGPVRWWLHSFRMNHFSLRLFCYSPVYISKVSCARGGRLVDCRPREPL